MTPRSARRFVLGSVAVSSIIVLFARTLEARRIPRARAFIAAVLVASFLSMIADASPQLAASFAGLVLVSALLTSGADVLGRVQPTLGGLTP